MSDSFSKNMRHDEFVKSNLKKLAVAKDTLKILLPTEIQEKIDLDTLDLFDTEHIQAFSNKQSLADVVYKFRLKTNAPGLLHVHLEAQSKPDPTMPHRMFEMMVALQRQFITNAENNKTDKLPLPVVYPIIVYHGDTSYHHSTRWLDCFSPSEQNLVTQILTKPLPLFDLTNVPDNEFVRHIKAAFVYYGLKHAHDKRWEDMVSGLRKLLEQLINEHHLEEEYLSDLLTIVLNYSLVNFKGNIPVDALKTTLEELTEGLPDKVGERVMYMKDVLIDEGIRLGREEGIEEGIELGEERGEKRTIRRIVEALLFKKLPDTLIIDSTGISKKELQELKCQDHLKSDL